MKNKLINSSSFIKAAITNTLRIWMREYQLIFADVGVMVLIFVVPLIYPLLYSFIYSPEVVRDMPIAVVDLSHSADSRQFTRDLDATSELKVASHTLSMEEAITLFKKREVKGIVQIPESFAKEIATNRQTTISAYADMEYFLYYKALITGVNFVGLEKGSQIQINNLMNKGLTERQAEIVAEPIKIVGNSIANQAGGFASYGIPAALILIIQQTLVIAIGMLAGTARERHAYGALVPNDRRKMGALRLVIGKAAAHFSIYAVLSIYMLGMIPRWFGYGQSADLLALMALITPFLLSSIFMGIALSVIFKNRESSMMLYLFTSIPLLFLSGIIWPLSNFGTVNLFVRELFPSSNAIIGFIKMNSLGASIFETRKEILLLWIQTGVYFLTAFIVYVYQVNYAVQIRRKLAWGKVKKSKKGMWKVS